MSPIRASPVCAREARVVSNALSLVRCGRDVCLENQSIIWTEFKRISLIKTSHFQERRKGFANALEFWKHSRGCRHRQSTGKISVSFSGSRLGSKMAQDCVKNKNSSISLASEHVSGTGFYLILFWWHMQFALEFVCTTTSLDMYLRAAPLKLESQIVIVMMI